MLVFQNAATMSKVVEYVGFFHLLKDRVKESWTQFWLNRRKEDEVDGNGQQFPDLEKETNFRKKVKEKLERLREETIRKINHSAQDSQDQQDFSHIYR